MEIAKPLNDAPSQANPTAELPAQASPVVPITGATETATKAMIAAVFDAIAASAAEGDDVAIPGFGKFTVKSRPERQGRNPATGEAMTIKASRKVSFAAAKGLKDRL